jgi:hypothetical protein
MTSITHTQGRVKMDGLQVMGHLWRGGAHAYLWTDRTRESHWFHPDRLPCIPRDWKGSNIYVGVHPTSSIPPTNAQGEPRPPEQVRSQLKYVSAINGLFCEVDAKDEEGSCSAHRKAEALKRIYRCPIEPTLLIDSGGGYHCVPLNTEILTRDGWKTYDQVQPGETVLGYNRETDATEWTTMRAKIVKTTEKLVNVSNGVFEAICTPDHNWVCNVKEGHQGERTVYRQLVPAQKISRRRHKIILSAPFENNQEHSTITPNEAALLGWFATEGSMTKKEQIRISQSERLYSSDIRSLLVDVPHTESYSHPPSDMITWHINTGWFRSLLQRAELTNGKHKSDWCKFVTRLSNAARDAFLDAAFKGDGTWNYNAKGIIQNPGNIADAIKLAIFLSGYTPLVTHCADRGTEFTRYGKPFATWNMSVRDAGAGAVWCPQTDLGTWVMRQGDTICITGNCYWYLADTIHLDDSNRANMGSLQARWVEFIGADKASKDLTRVLRVPGTINHKYADKPIVTVIEYTPGLLYRLDDFESLLPAQAPKPIEPTTQTRAATSARSNAMDSVIAEFNAQHPVHELLMGYGYPFCFRQGATVRLARPGRTCREPSVTVDTVRNESTHYSSTDKLYSTNALDPFEIETRLKHDGNHQRAYEAIKKELGRWVPKQPRQYRDPLTGNVEYAS